MNPTHIENLESLIFEIFCTLKPQEQVRILERLRPLVESNEFQEIKYLELALSPSIVERLKEESQTQTEYLEKLRAVYDEFAAALAANN